jgi:hypothetical protein
LKYCFICAQNIVLDSLHSKNNEKHINNFQNKNISSIERGYIGIFPEISSLNYSKQHPNLGFRINIDAAYKLSKILGITVLLTGAVNTYDNAHSVPSPTPGNPFFKRIEYDKEKWEYGGLLIGPLFSIPLGKKKSWDISPLFGISGIKKPYYENCDSPFTLDFNTKFIFKSSHKIAFSISGDFFLADKYSSRFGITTVNIGLGMIFRFVK